MRRHHGFARIELAAVLAVGAVILSLLIVQMRDARRSASLTRDLANLRQIAGLTGSYAADNRDLFWTFSWRRGRPLPSVYPDLQGPEDRDVQAAANQAVDILRRRAGREIAKITAWYCYLMYSHLVLAEYADLPLPTMAGSPRPDLRFVSAADEHRLRWAKDPAAFDRGLFQPYQPPSSGSVSNSGRRWPYSSSFQISTAIYDRSPLGQRVEQTGHSSYVVPTESDLHAHRFSTTAFPAQKVHLHAEASWHTGRRLYSAVPEARITVLMADGSAALRKTADANPGWLPNDPESPEPIRFQYAPALWEAPTSTGEPSEIVIGHYRWTRGGLEGIDFGGPEINTGQR